MRASCLIVGHGTWYKDVCLYNQKLPEYLLTRDKVLGEELLVLRNKILEGMKKFKLTLSDRDVLEQLNNEKQT